MLWQNRGTVHQGRMPHNVCKGHWEFRHTFSFIWQPAQIHIHVQLCLAGTSLYQRCLLPDEIPGAPNSPYQASVLWRTVSRFCSNMEKTVFIVKRKTNHLERWYFIIRKTVSWNATKFFWRNPFCPASQSPNHMHENNSWFFLQCITGNEEKQAGARLKEEP